MSAADSCKKCRAQLRQLLFCFKVYNRFKIQDILRGKNTLLFNVYLEVAQLFINSLGENVPPRRGLVVPFSCPFNSYKGRKLAGQACDLRSTKPIPYNMAVTVRTPSANTLSGECQHTYSIPRTASTRMTRKPCALLMYRDRDTFLRVNRSNRSDSQRACGRLLWFFATCDRAESGCGHLNPKAVKCVFALIWMRN